MLNRVGAQRAGRGPVIGHLKYQKPQRYQEGGSQADDYAHLSPGSQHRGRRLGCPRCPIAATNSTAVSRHAPSESVPPDPWPGRRE